MNFTDLYEDNDEDILSDIINSFPQSKNIPNKESTKSQPSRALTPIIIQGKVPDGFSQWLRSKEQVRQAIQDTMGTPKMSLENCIKLYTHHNIKIDDYVVIEFPPQSIHKYREYDREIADGWTGKMDQEEYRGLINDIKNNGIRNPGILDVVNLSAGTYKVYLGEGNHRLNIAMKLGIKTMPLTFYYRYE